MKIRYLLFLMLPVALLSCNKEGAFTDSFFRANVAGPSWTGNVDIMGELGDVGISALISPSGDPAIPDILFLSFGDPSIGVSASIIVPAEKRVTELTGDHEVFDMALGGGPPEQVGLMAKSISVDVKTLKTTNGGLAGLTIPSKVVGSFTGVMVRTYLDMNGDEVEESHLVDGSFEYYL